MDAGLEPDTAGFTLVELLVAVAVLSVLAVGVSLATSRGSGGGEDAERFARAYASQRQLAVQGQEWRGMHVTPQGSRTARRAGAQWRDVGRETRWRGRVALASDGVNGPGDTPDIVFLPNGRTSAFSIRFGGGSGTMCRSDGWTGLTCDAG